MTGTMAPYGHMAFLPCDLANKVVGVHGWRVGPRPLHLIKLTAVRDRGPVMSAEPDATLPDSGETATLP